MRGEPARLSMQIQELEDCLGGGLVERRQGEAVLTGAGHRDRGARREDHFRDTRSCRLRVPQQGVVRYLEARCHPDAGALYPAFHHSPPATQVSGLRLSLLEAHTKTLLSELTRGNVDLLLLALPIQKSDVETADLFDDRFLLALPADDPLPETARATPQDVRQRNLILLEEGHCLRGQALDYCPSATDDSNGFFGTSLTTIMQMVASGYGVTLLPEVATDAEVRDERIKLSAVCGAAAATKRRADVAANVSVPIRLHRFRPDREQRDASRNALLPSRSAQSFTRGTSAPSTLSGT